MKILMKLLAGIGILAALLCALIVLSASNPDITRKLSSLLSQIGLTDQKKAERTAPEESEAAVPEDSGSATPDAELPAAPENQEDQGAGEEGGSETPQPADTAHRQNFPDDGVDGQARGAQGYEPPPEAEVRVPEAVSGKSGYQPITEKSEELPGAEGGEYVSSLGYGETGDGLTFDPVLYPYYQMLEQKGQHLYRQVFANATAFNPAFVPIEAVPVSEIKNVVMAVYNDHPELFWLNTVFVCKYDQNKICAELGLDFNMTKEELPTASTAFFNAANDLLTQVEHLGNYEKERQLHDLLIARIEYDKGADKNQSAYSALVSGKTVCAGYARAYQYLLQRLGIPCYYCTGYAGTDHAWNIVALEDGYYNVDVTWDDTPGGEYDYFNKTDEDFAGTHVRRELSVNLPKCEGQQYRSL